MRQDVYRVAYDEANAELTEIVGRFEELRLRKDRIEKVVEVLKPLVASEAQAAPTENSAPLETSEPSPQDSEPVTYSFQQVGEPVAVPQQRRTDTGFGLGSAARDVREYSRLFNGGDSRGN
ncbi:MAG: hypothetical protein WBM14_14210 [Terracidiphilus sp.]